VTQSGPPFSLLGNRTGIAQNGSNNTAIVRQSGESYVAQVNQTGTGNYANIYQH
jgi:hypothetical protein